MQQQVEVVTAFPALGGMVLLAGIVLLIYLATKGCKRSLLSVLGVGVLLLLVALVSWVVVGSLNHKTTIVETNHPPMTVAIDNEHPISSVATPSDRELWDRLTKPQIELDVERDAKSAESETGETQTVEAAEESDGTDEPAVEVKPDWVENPPKRMGNVFRRVVSSGPYKTVDECHSVLEDQLRDAVRERVQTLVAEEAGESITIPEPASFGIGLDYIMREICRDEFTETVSVSFGDMKKVYVLMEFSPAVETELRTAWQQHERYHRLSLVGAIAAGALGLLATLYGMLKVDTWTRGYYTKRLLLGVPAAIIAIAVLLSL